MMAISLGQLLTAVTESQAFSTYLGVLKELGFPVTAWNPGRVQHTKISLLARMYSEINNAIVAHTQSGFPKRAVGAYADLLGQYMFNETRVPAEETEGYLNFAVDLSAQSFVYAAGAVRIKVGGQVFELIEAVNISPGSDADARVRAVVAGVAGNVATDSICELVAPVVVGVTVTNPEYADDTWIVVEGYDQETTERYMTRCLAKLEAIGYGVGEGAYRYWTLQALPSVNRVTVAQGSGDGEIEITAATAEGALTGGQITTITDYIDGADGIGRRPINDIVTVGTVSEITSPALTVTAYVLKAYAAAAEDLITAALENYLANLPIGGKVLVSAPGKARQADMITAIMNVQGVQNVTGVPSDVTLDTDEIYNPAITVTVVEV
jgi:hypothetical protein